MGRSAAVLVVAVAVLAGSGGANARTGANCARTSVSMTPLTDLGQGRYRGYRGGLNANGKNTPPAAYERMGLAAAQAVRPIDGKIVLLSIGMSNTTQEFSAFAQVADASRSKAAGVQLVDGAQPGQDAEKIKDPAARYWDVWLVNERVRGELAGPWLGWGPYLWTNGEKGRSDGLTWTCADVRPSDGTHPSASGQAKVASLLWRFFTTDPTTRSWFVAS